MSEHRSPLSPTILRASWITDNCTEYRIAALLTKFSAGQTGQETVMIITCLASSANRPCPSLTLSTQNCNSGPAPLEPLTSLKAITILLDQHNDEIFAYLKFARSLRQNLLYSPGHGSLSLDQYRAVWALSNCSDVDIRTWLKEARKPLSDSGQRKCSQDETLQEPTFAYLSSSGQVQEGLYAPAITAPPNLVQTEGSNQSTLIASSLHSQRVLDKTDTSREATKATNRYWCTICEDRSYQNISEWRRHEKAHEDTYFCMLGGPVDQAEGCVRCSLCGTLNPSEKHLGAHNTHLCGQGVPGSFFCKRRADLVRHLKKCHNVPEKAQGEAVADKWKKTTNKQAWSCGFCIHPVHSFGDRLKHIAKHFERGQTLDRWDTTNVIEGLLLQPGMVYFWKMPLDWRSSKSIWKQEVVKDLQRDLELGPSDPMHAAALVERVYNARQSDLQVLNDDRSFTFAPIHEAREPAALAPTSDNDSTTKRVFQPGPIHEQSQFVEPAETIRNGIAMGGNLMATYGYGTLPVPFPDEDGNSIKGPSLLNPGQTWLSATSPYIGYNVDQEHSDATFGRDPWPTPAVSRDDPNGNDMWA